MEKETLQNKKKDKKNKKNSYSILLQELLAKTGLKNAALSEALQYDVSYISKWVTGRFLPSEKNITQISDGIASCVVHAIEPEQEEEWFSQYQAGNQEELEQEISRALINAYYQSKGKVISRQQEMSAGIVHMPMRGLIEMMDFSGNQEESIKVAAVVDILSLDRESRLLLAYIEKGRFRLKERLKNIQLSMIMEINPATRKENADDVYDAIFLIHMLTSLSYVDVQLYNQMFAHEKVIYAVKDRFALTAMLHAETFSCLGVSKNEDLAIVNDWYRTVGMMCDQESMIFRKSSICEMLRNHEYVQLMIATEKRWLLGHMTELLLPDEIFYELLGKLPAKWQEDAENLEKAHNFSANILKNSEISIMIYESAFTDFIISGELDFYNHKVCLDVEQRLQVLCYYLEKIQEEKKGQIKLIEGGFSTDFQYITNPCMFLSSSICYLRLENGCYENNIFVLQDRFLKEMFERFYEKIWHQRQDVVLEEDEKVCERIKQYISSVQLLRKME